jgi:hypothetical protein
MIKRTNHLNFELKSCIFYVNIGKDACSGILPTYRLETERWYTATFE